MKKDLSQIVFALMVLVFGGALEELLPKFVGVGFPFLLMSAVFLAPRRGVVPAVLFAIAAGGCEDALSSLPFAASVSFFTLAALAARTVRFSFVVMSVAFPLYETWLWLWRGALDGGVFGRFAAAVPLGLATAAATALALFWLERAAAIQES